jgi:uncharacterized protein YbcI
MDKTQSNIAEQLALAARQFHEQRTGHAPKAVTVVVGEDTLVVTLHDALTPAEKALAKSSQGAARLQEFHRQLFANSTAELWQEIKRITGRDVREAAAEIETETGSVILAFGSGAMVQVFLLRPRVAAEADAENNALERADDEGLRVAPPAELPDDS